MNDIWFLQLRTHSEDELLESGLLPLPQRTINVKASELLNITITKSLILLSYHLMDSFEKAAKLISPSTGRTLPGSSKYLVFNNAGISIKVGNTETLIVSYHLIMGIFHLSGSYSCHTFYWYKFIPYSHIH